MKKLIKKHLNGKNIYYISPQYGFSPATSQTNVYQPIVTDVQRDKEQGKPIGTTTAKREIRAAQQKQKETIQAPVLSKEGQDIVNRAAQTANILQPVNTALDVIEYFPIVGDAISIGRAGTEAINGNLLGAGLIAGMTLIPGITSKPVKEILPKHLTPEQWTAAQDAAIARGDMAEAQRLRDLHQSLTPTATSGKYYRGTKTRRNSYPDRHIDEEVGEMNGIYLTKKPKYARTYGDVEEFYLRSNNPLETEGSWTGVIDDAARAEIENAGYDAVVNNKFDTGFLNRLLRNSRDETITFDGRNLKLADAVTYDDKGVRIPLGERDNFKLNDIRYSLLPFILGSAYIGGSLK